MRVAVDHVKLPVADIDRTRQFYRAALAPLGYGVVYDNDEDELGFGNADANPLGFIQSGAPAVGTHVAFTARGAPASTPSMTQRNAAFVIDPDGHNIEAVHHGQRA